ncbi:hypothetical protein STEG23_023969, partial [Scotinomys teguina]
LDGWTFALNMHTDILRKQMEGKVEMNAACDLDSLLAKAKMRSLGKKIENPNLAVMNAFSGKLTSLIFLFSLDDVPEIEFYNNEFFEKGYLCVALASHSVDHAGLKLTEIHLALPLEYWDKRFDELVKKFKVEYHAGGSTQNSMKVAQVKCFSCFLIVFDFAYNINYFTTPISPQFNPYIDLTGLNSYGLGGLELLAIFLLLPLVH